MRGTSVHVCGSHLGFLDMILFIGILSYMCLVVFLLASNGDALRNIIEDTDSDDSLDRMLEGLGNQVHFVCCPKPIRRIVFGLPAVCAVPVKPIDVPDASSPNGTSVRSRDQFDRPTGVTYFRDREANGKRQRVESHDLASD